MGKWKAGLVAAVMAGVAGFGCGTVEPADESLSAEAGLSGQPALDEVVATGPNGGGIDIVRFERAGDQCGSRTCFRIKAEKNISHVFLDFGECPVKDFRVLARTPFTDEYEDVTDRLKTRGGPCQDIDAQYRFEVRGPDRDDPKEIRKAEVCVVFEDYIAGVTIGAKAANECAEESYGLRAQHDGCKQCKKGH